MRPAVLLVGAALIGTLPGAPTESRPEEAGEKEFAAQAYAALPVEEPYAFLAGLGRGEDPAWRDPAARPAPGELALPARGWSLVLAKGAGEVVRAAAGQFQDFLAGVMGCA